jgi:DNA-binding CsgD family transcriptional regulator
VTTAGASHGLGVVGREQELDVLHAFVEVGGSPSALVLTGGPGLGKTTLWEASVAAARRRRMRVLVARPSDAEATLAFAGLIDLFDGVESEALASVPAPQLNALEVALLRAAPSGAAPEPHAIALGVLNALRTLAERDPLLIAVDDVQWLDPPSASALAFAARRLEDAGVAFVLAKRPGTSSSVEQALEPAGVQRLELDALSLGATRHLLNAKLGLTLSRQLMRRIYDTTLGNPLFSLEVGRKLVEDGVPAIGEDLPVPDAVEDLLGTRVAGLPAAQRRLLLAVALSPSIRVAQLVALADRTSLADAIEAGVLVVDGDHVRASHPLLAAAATRDAPEAERRELHRALADVVAEGELRTRHLALAAAGTDAELASTVARAARDAAGHGAAHAAVELADHALRLTPHADPSRNERLLELAEYLGIAAERQRVRELLEPALETLPAGPQRARAHLLITAGTLSGWGEIQVHLERALSEQPDTATRAAALASMAQGVAAVRVERIREAEAWAREAVSTASTTRVLQSALYALGWTRALAGHSIDDLCDRFRESAETALYMAESPERVAGQRLVWRGELSEARTALTRLLAMADERGEPSSYALQRLHLCELELRAGDWAAAERLLDEWALSTDRVVLLWPMYERCRALVAAGRGRPDEAERWAEEAIARADATGVRWDRFESVRALGIVDLLRQEPQKAAERLRPVWTHMEREEVEDPGVFPVVAELVEALTAVGEHDEAVSVTERLRRLAEEQAHPWGLSTAERCAAMIELTRRYDEQAVTTLEQVAGRYARLGVPLDAARTLLALGGAQRRHRKWGAARETLQRACSAFDELGSDGWADAARADLARVGARRPPGENELTPTERRVAELAAEGLANKEIAQALVVTVSTVEFHLRNTYAKLGIRSRTQLAERLAATQSRRRTGA